MQEEGLAQFVSSLTRRKNDRDGISDVWFESCVPSEGFPWDTVGYFF